MKRVPLVSTILLLLCISVHAQTVLPDDGGVKNGVYYNTFFGFGFRYPKDWVVQDEAINQRIRDRAKEEAAKLGTSSELKDTYLLFTVSRYARGTQGSGLNPTILIIAEKITPAPKNYNGKDFLLEVRPSKLKSGAKPLLNEPVEFLVGGFQFFRDDYSSEVNGVQIRGAIFVTVKKGYAIGFSFSGQDQKSVEEMATAMDTVLPLGMGPGVHSSP